MTKTFTKLTRPELRKLPAGATLTEHGITFERLATGDGVYAVNVMVDGQRIHRVIGRESDGTTRTQAEDFITKIRNDAKHASRCPRAARPRCPSAMPPRSIWNGSPKPTRATCAKSPRG